MRGWSLSPVGVSEQPAVSNNKSKGVINARRNILQVQNCISWCALSFPLVLLSDRIFYFDSDGDADYVSSSWVAMAEMGGGSKREVIGKSPGPSIKNIDKNKQTKPQKGQKLGVVDSREKIQM